jgi:C-terminal processing protease CtpA/Prc
MKKSIVFALLFILALRLSGQTAKPAPGLLTRQTVQSILGFEAEDGGALPMGWSGSTAGTIVADNKTVHSGKWSVRLERGPGSTDNFSTIWATIPMDFTGKIIELRGYLSMKDVSNFAGLWMRENQDETVVAYTNMQSQHLQGSKEWAEYSITLPVNPDATSLTIGIHLWGTGKVWGDDLQLLADGKAIALAPTKIPTAASLDHEFDHGSHIAPDTLSSLQIENLVTLGRVWGFLKYHHPLVTSGQRNWDYEMFRILPGILSAKTRAEANLALAHWIDSFGAVAECSHYASLDSASIELKPDLGWIEDGGLLGMELSQRLRNIYAKRTEGQQYYVSLAGPAGNPVFDHENSDSSIHFPDAGFQLLALYRFWNIMQYWSPYREAAGENWPAVLSEFVPKVTLAKDKDAFQLAMMELVARAHDTHANLWSSLRVRPPLGDCVLSADIRFIDNEAVVAGFADKSAKESSGLRSGDILLELDGKPAEHPVGAWMPLYADSNQPARLRDMAMYWTRGKCGLTPVKVRRADKEIVLNSNRSASAVIFPTHDLPGDTFRLLSPEVAYLKLGTAKAADMASFVELAKDTKGMIIDLRDYPEDFSGIYVLGSLLATGHTEFAIFTHADLSNPGAYHFGNTAALEAGPLHYKGKVVILVDEVTQSRAEFAAMALRSVPNAVVVGSTTAGADGDLSAIILPGGLSAAISGNGVYYPDKRPTQRIGIVPDIEAKPTITGIEAGRDEVLEVGIQHILGSDASSGDIQKIARAGGDKPGDFLQSR